MFGLWDKKLLGKKLLSYILSDYTPLENRERLSRYTKNIYEIEYKRIETIKRSRKRWESMSKWLNDKKNKPDYFEF
jgi:hypothetical protein